MEKSKKKWIGLLITIFSLILMFISSSSSGELESSPSLTSILAYISFFFVGPILAVTGGFEEKKNKKKYYEQPVQKIFPEVPYSAKILKINKYGSREFKTPLISQLWLDGQTLHIFMCDDKKSLSSVVHEELKLNDINYYFDSGVHYTENKISGGGGGASTLGGAVVGGVLFGPVGAVIGSRKKVDSVTSKLLVHDTRETILKYTKQGSEYFIHFVLDELKVLYSLIPRKNFDYVMREEEKQFSKVKSTNNASDDLTNRLRRLKQMKDEGFLNDQEYEAKRQEIIQVI